MKDNRYNEMLWITSIVQQYLKQFLEIEFKEELYYGIQNDSFRYMFERRFAKKIWLRPYVCAMVFKQYGRFYSDEGETVNQIILPALTVSEVFNISTYQSNVVFDDKIKNQSISNVNQFISSFITFNLAIKLLQKTKIPYEKLVSCIDVLNESNENVYLGQYIDLNLLVVNNVFEVMSMAESDYLKLYLERCEKIGGTTVDTCATWAYLIAGKENAVELEKLRELFRTWGQLMQMANDLSDYTVFINQKNYVRYTDIKAGKITLPFYFILTTMPQEEATSFVSSMHEYNDEVLDVFFQKYLYVDSEIILRVFDVMRSLWQKCRRLMADLELDRKRFQFLFENAFLTKFSRCFFSNKLIKQI